MVHFGEWFSNPPVTPRHSTEHGLDFGEIHCPVSQAFIITVGLSNFSDKHVSWQIIKCMHQPTFHADWTFHNHRRRFQKAMRVFLERDGIVMAR